LSKAGLILIKTVDSSLSIEKVIPVEEPAPMRDVEKAAFERKLDEFSDRLRLRTEEFSKSGGFSDVHEALLKDIQRRNEKLKRKVKEARTSSVWEMIKAEIVRDYNVLFDDLLQFEERLDTEFKKTNKGSRPSVLR